MILNMSGNKRLSIEITNRCRLECEKCTRTQLKGKMPIKDMSVQDFRRIAESKMYNNIFFGGTYGDCIYHPQFKEILKITKENDIALTIHSNGSGKKLEWWREVFEILNPKKDMINIAMDGYKETSSMYRVNFKARDFDKNIEMMSVAANEYKIRTLWTFIPMNFNENQIQDAAKLAIENNIIFCIKKSNRWFSLKDPRLPTNLKLISSHSKVLDLI